MGTHCSPLKFKRDRERVGREKGRSQEGRIKETLRVKCRRKENENKQKE